MKATAPTVAFKPDTSEVSNMAKRICSDCGGPHHARGYCKKCHKRRMRSGELEATQDHLVWPESLLQRMEPQPNGCIHFVNGQVDAEGYGRLDYPGGQYAHRAAYEHFVGPIPEGHTIDHECHNGSGCNLKSACLHRRCVNGEHLVAKPIGENLKASPNTFQGKNARKTSCPKSHPYDEANTYVDPQGKRHCRACQREAAARRRAG